MNKEYKIEDGKVYIKDDNDDEKEASYTDNLEEELICQNTLEKTIALLTSNEEISQKSTTIKKKTKKIMATSLSINIALIIIINLIFNFPTQGIAWIISLILLSPSNFIVEKGINTLLDEAYDNITISKEIMFLTAKKEKYQQQLDNIRESAKKISRDYTPTYKSPTKVCDKKALEELKQDLFVTCMYACHETEYQEYHRQGILREKLKNQGCTQESIDIIENMISISKPKRKILLPKIGFRNTHQQ